MTTIVSSEKSRKILHFKNARFRAMFDAGLITREEASKIVLVFRATDITTYKMSARRR